MRGPLRWLTIGAVVLLALGCSYSDSGEQIDASTTEDTTGQVGRDDDATNASNYEIAFQLCGEVPARQLAEDLGVASTDPVDLANAFAEGYTDRFRQAGFEGCLDALLGEPANPP